VHGRFKSYARSGDVVLKLYHIPVVIPPEN